MRAVMRQKRVRVVYIQLLVAIFATSAISGPCGTEFRHNIEAEIATKVISDLETSLKLNVELDTIRIPNSDEEAQNPDLDELAHGEATDPSYLLIGNNTLTHLAQMRSICGKYRPRSHSGHSAARIAGGYSANLGNFPSYVRLKVHTESSDTICGGTIISEWLIVTAAHCFKGQQAVSSVEIYAGSVHSNAGTQLRASQLCIPKEAHYDIDNHDMAILIMEEPIQFNENIQPACLPPRDIDYKSQAFVVGFGKISGSSTEMPNRLQVLPVRRNFFCYNLGANSVCYQSNDPRYVGDTCQGDSGGPAYTNVNGRQTLVAIVSRGMDTCTSGTRQVSVYMNVYKLNYKMHQAVRSCRPLSSGDRRTNI